MLPHLATLTSEAREVWPCLSDQDLPNIRVPQDTPDRQTYRQVGQAGADL